MRAATTSVATRIIGIESLLRLGGTASVPSLYPKVLVQLLHLHRELGVRDHVDHTAVLDDVMPVGDGGGEMEVLLHQEDGEPLGLEPSDGDADLLHDHGRQSL